MSTAKIYTVTVGVTCKIEHGGAEELEIEVPKVVNSTSMARARNYGLKLVMKEYGVDPALLDKGAEERELKADVLKLYGLKMRIVDAELTGRFSDSDSKEAQKRRKARNTARKNRTSCTKAELDAAQKKLDERKAAKAA